jgi:serine phosphatase RsbU (regulator of sigma subunit)
MAEARLHVTDRTGRRVAAISRSPFTIGRGADSDLPVAGGEVSRAHAEIDREGDRYVLRDRASRYGTFVNGEPATERQLVEGDRIRLGRSSAVELVFLQEPEAAALGRESLVEVVRQTAALLEGLRALGAGHLLNDVLQLVLDAAIVVSGADRGFIMLARPGGQLDVTLGRAAGRIVLSGPHFMISRKIPEDVFATGEPRIVADLVDDAGEAHDATVALGIRQVLCVPLKLTRFLDGPGAAPEATRIGVLYLDSREAGALLSDTVRNGVETLATEAAVAIENARLYREAVEKARVDQELRIAAEMQKALRPPARYSTATFEIVAASRSSRAISGDFFHYMELRDAAFGFALGDVAGKGPPAAVLGAAVQGMFTAYAEGENGAAGTLTRLNATLGKHFAESRFATLFYGILHHDGRLIYSNAGHNPPMLFARGGAVRRLEAGGVPLGLFPGSTYPEEALRLVGGDTLVLFSDGVSETESPTGVVFGDEGVVSSIQANTDLEPQVLLDGLLERVDAFRAGGIPADDVTAMVLRFRG